MFIQKITLKQLHNICKKFNWLLPGGTHLELCILSKKSLELGIGNRFCKKRNLHRN